MSVWNTGLPPGGQTGSGGPSNVWPGSGVWPGMPSGSLPGDGGLTGENVSGGSGRLNIGGAGLMHAPLFDDVFGGRGPAGDPIGGINNGLSLSGAWASGGFNTQGMPPMSGWQQFSGTAPFNSPMAMSAIPGGTPMPGLGIGSVPVAGANPNQPFGGVNTGIPGGGGTSGFTGLPGVDAKSLEKIYGKGVGAALSKFLSSGAGFNPAVIQAQINAAMPLEARTTAKMMDIFGNQGAAYSSTAALGIGDFESQFNAALQGQFAQEYQQSVQNYLNVLMGVAPSAQQEHAQAPNWLSAASDIATAIMGFYV